MMTFNLATSLEMLIGQMPNLLMVKMGTVLEKIFVIEIVNSTREQGTIGKEDSHVVITIRGGAQIPTTSKILHYTDMVQASRVAGAYNFTHTSPRQTQGGLAIQDTAEAIDQPVDPL